MPTVPLSQRSKSSGCNNTGIGSCILAVSSLGSEMISVQDLILGDIPIVAADVCFRKGAPTSDVNGVMSVPKADIGGSLSCAGRRIALIN